MRKEELLLQLYCSGDGKTWSEVTVEIVFNIPKGRTLTYLDVKSRLHLFGFIVYWYAWI